MGDVVGQAVVQWQWGYIVLSFVVSVVGCGTSLLLIRHRQSTSLGILHHLLLLSAAIAFGAVGTFSMHFVGMQALELSDPSTGAVLPIVYLPLPTAFSLLVVVAIACCGFVVVADPLQQQWWRYVLGGLAGAGGVLVMHYLGMNAMCMQAVIHYHIGWMAGSVVIGVVVVSGGLLVFFRFRLYWQHSNVVLGLASLVLAAGVCGVHYAGMQSALYDLSDAPPTCLQSLPSSHVVTLVTLALAAVSVLLALSALAVRWVQTLRLERAKLRSLTLQVVVLDSTRQSVLTCTIADQHSLPSAVICPAYAGQGKWEAHNSDFLRMLKASSQWDAIALYTAFLEGLCRQAALTPHSLALHRQFLDAAAQLAAKCRLDVRELGLVYWKPTASTVTLVVHADADTGARIALTTDLRFLPLATVYPYLAAVIEGAGDEEPKQWMARLLDYHAKTQTDPSLSFPTASASASPETHVGLPLGARLSLFGSSRVVPLDASGEAHRETVVDSIEPSPADSPVSTTPVQVYLGLLYVRVAPTGLHLMVPADGPYWSVPMVPLLSSPHPITGLTAEQAETLLQLRRRGQANAAGGPALSSRFKSVRAASSLQQLSRHNSADATDDGGDVTPASAHGDLDPTDADDPIPPLHDVGSHDTAAPSDPALHLNLQAARPRLHLSAHSQPVPSSRASVVSAHHAHGSVVDSHCTWRASDGVGGVDGAPIDLAFEFSVKAAMAALQQTAGGYDVTVEGTVRGGVGAGEGGRWATDAAAGGDADGCGDGGGRDEGEGAVGVAADV